MAAEESYLEHLNQCMALASFGKIQRLCFEQDFERAFEELKSDSSAFALTDINHLRSVLLLSKGTVDSTWGGAHAYQIIGETLFHTLLETGHTSAFLFALEQLTENAPQTKKEVLKEILELTNISGWNVRSCLREDAPQELKDLIESVGVKPTPKILPHKEPNYVAPVFESALQVPEFYEAVHQQHLYKMTVLIKSGVPIDALPFSMLKEWQPSLHREVERKQTCTSYPIIAYWADGIERVPNPLVLDFLLAHGADINAKVFGGISIIKSLLRSLGRNNQSFIPLLIERGALLDEEDCRLIREAQTQRFIPQELQIRAAQIIQAPVVVKAVAKRVKNSFRTKSTSPAITSSITLTERKTPPIFIQDDHDVETVAHSQPFERATSSSTISSVFFGSPSHNKKNSEELRKKCRELLEALETAPWQVVHLFRTKPTFVRPMIRFLKALLLAPLILISEESVVAQIKISAKTALDKDRHFRQDSTSIFYANVDDADCQTLDDIIALVNHIGDEQSTLRYC